MHDHIFKDKTPAKIKLSVLEIWHKISKKKNIKEH